MPVAYRHSPAYPASREAMRQTVLHHLDRLLRGEIDALQVEKTDAGNVVLSVAPRRLCEKIGELAK